MRLIDADKIDFSKVFGGHSEFAKDLIVAAEELVVIQPTAFDKEKVGSQIQDSIELAVSDPLFYGRYIKKQMALEIIEKGGIE